LTNFVDAHPGGKVILSCLGKNCTLEVLQQHLLSHEQILSVIKKYTIGKAAFPSHRFEKKEFVLTDEFKSMINEVRRHVKEENFFWKWYPCLHVLSFSVLWMYSVWASFSKESLFWLVIFSLFLHHPVDLYSHFDGHFTFIAPNRSRFFMWLIYFAQVLQLGRIESSKHWYYLGYQAHSDNITGLVCPSNHYYHHAFTGFPSDLEGKGLEKNQVFHDTDADEHDGFPCCASDYGLTYPAFRVLKTHKRQWWHRYQHFYALVWLLLQPRYTIKIVWSSWRTRFKKGQYIDLMIGLLASPINPMIPLLPFFCLRPHQALAFTFVMNFLSNALFVPYHIAQHYLAASPQRSKTDENSDEMNWFRMQVLGSASIRSHWLLDTVLGLIDPGLQTEHHLFPALPFHVLPVVTKILLREKTTGYMMYSHTGAWRAIFERLRGLSH